MTFRHGYVRHGQHRYGLGSPTYTNSDSPWYITTGGELGTNIRAEGLTTGSRPGAVRPGRTISYTFVFLQQSGRGFTAREHVERYRTARELLVRADDTVVYGDVTGDEVRYREQHGDADGTQLVRIGPLERTSDASAPAGAAPPGRESLFEPRWAVVEGGEGQATMAPDRLTSARLTLEATTIAPASAFDSRTAVRAAREVNGL